MGEIEKVEEKWKNREVESDTDEENESELEWEPIHGEGDVGKY